MRKVNVQDKKIGIVLSYIQVALNMVTGLFLSAFFVRVLGKTEYGIYQTVSAFANYLVLLQFGTGTVMTRNIAICKAKKASAEEINRNISTIWIINHILVVFILLLSAVFYCSFDNIYKLSMTAEQIAYSKKILIFVTGYLVLSYCQQTLSGIALAMEYYSFASFNAIARILVRVVCLVVLLMHIPAAILIAVVDMALSGVMLIWTYYFCKKKCHTVFSVRLFDLRILKECLPLSFAILVQTFVNQANNNVDKTIVSIVQGPEAVAVYSVGLYIYSVFSSLTTIPISMYGPQVARDLSSEKKMEDVVNNLVAPSRFIVLIGGTVLFGFIAVGKQFVQLVYGNGYQLSWIIAVIIMIPMLLNMSTGVLINILDVLNKRWIRSMILLFSTILNIILSLWLVNPLGMVGLAIATAVSTFLGQIFLSNLYYNKLLNISVLKLYNKIFEGLLGNQIIACMIACVIVARVSSIFGAVVVGTIVYCVVFSALYCKFGMKENEKMLFQQLYKRIKK